MSAATRGAPRSPSAEELTYRAVEVWAITCFYVKSGIRRHGIMARLIEEAADHARRNGGTSLEAYPVVPGSPSYRFCGFTPVFEERGFVEAGRAGLRRHVMRRALT